MSFKKLKNIVAISRYVKYTKLKHFKYLDGWEEHEQKQLHEYS